MAGAHKVLGAATGCVVFTGSRFGVERRQRYHDEAGGGPRVPDRVRQRRKNTGGQKEGGGSTS